MLRSSFVIALFIQVATCAEAPVRTTSAQPPRKVIVGTAMQAFWVTYPGVDKRLEQLAGIVDNLAAESMKKYGRGLDLAVLPEAAVTGEFRDGIASGPVPFEGAVKEMFARKAREHHCYIVVPMYLLEDKVVSNVAILIGRQGEVVGTYRKLHLAVPTGS